MSKIATLIAVLKAIAPYVSDITAAAKAIWDIIQKNKDGFDITPDEPAAAIDADAVVAEFTALGVDETAARGFLS